MKESLFNLIYDNFSIKTIQSQRIRFIDGTSSRINAFVDQLQPMLKEFLSSEERLEYHDLSDKERYELVDSIARKAQKRQEADRIQDELDNADFNIQGLSILVELVDDQELYYLYDENTKDIAPYTYNGLKRLIPQQQFNTLEKKPCFSVYEPFDTDQNFNEVLIGQRPLVRVNTYKHPEWRDSISTFSGRDCDLPPLAQDFLEHLFPNYEAREYVFNWLNGAMTSKQGNEFILVLNGPTGTGKTIFATDLMLALFGEKNWGAAPKHLFESNFNSVLENKRLIFIDEAKINERDYNTVKLYANKKLNIEKKGMDANNTTDLYYSMILSNNKMGNIFVDPDDRRFSIVETTTDKLLDAWEDESVTEFVEALKDPDFVREIGEYILANYGSETLKQYKSARFYQFVWRHLSQWQKLVCNKIFKAGKEGETECEFSRLKSAIVNNKNIKYDVQVDTIIEFIESYKHEGLHKLGEVKYNSDHEYELIINKHFVENDDSDEIDEIDETDLL